MGGFGQKYHEPALNAVRVVAGLLFMTHGGQKLFGWFGAESAAAGVWPMGVAGVLEFAGGLLIAAGVFTRPVAFVVCGEMAVAYFWGHVARSGSLWPWANRGELALLFCLVWLVMWTSGGGSWQVQEWLRKRKAGAEVVREERPSRRAGAAVFRGG